MTRTCTKCKVEKSLDEFHKLRRVKLGVRSCCKTCRQEIRKTEYETNKEKFNAQSRLWYANNKERRKAVGRRWVEANREKANAIQRRWVKNNPAKNSADTARYKARKLQATIKLTKEEERQIKQIYALCARLNQTTNIKWHVDHIAPLAGVSVCGLHAPWNLRVIPAVENIRKKNKLEDNVESNNEGKKEKKTLIEIVRTTLAEALENRPPFTEDDIQSYYDTQRKGK